MSEGNPNHQHVAALLALDIDIAWDVVQACKDDAEALYGQLRILKRKRDQAISGDPEDVEATRRRYDTTCMLFSLPFSDDGGDNG